MKCNPAVGAPTTSCITVANLAPSGRQRAILILAGASTNGAVRPTASLADYLEFGNATGNFERRLATPPVSAGYADSGAANAYVIAATPVTIGAPLYFKAANTNTGAATLDTAATGVKNMVNADATVLGASAIVANTVVQVTYDGTQFLLGKRPFNDRVIAVDCNN